MMSQVPVLVRSGFYRPLWLNGCSPPTGWTAPQVQCPNTPSEQVTPRPPPHPCHSPRPLSWARGVVLQPQSPPEEGRPHRAGAPPTPRCDFPLMTPPRWWEVPSTIRRMSPTEQVTLTQDAQLADRPRGTPVNPELPRQLLEAGTGSPVSTLLCAFARAHFLVSLPTTPPAHPVSRRPNLPDCSRAVCPGTESLVLRLRPGRHRPRDSRRAPPGVSTAVLTPGAPRPLPSPTPRFPGRWGQGGVPRVLCAASPRRDPPKLSRDATATASCHVLATSRPGLWGRGVGTSLLEGPGLLCPAGTVAWAFSLNGVSRYPSAAPDSSEGRAGWGWGWTFLEAKIRPASAPGPAPEPAGGSSLTRLGGQPARGRAGLGRPLCREAVTLFARPVLLLGEPCGRRLRTGRSRTACSVGTDSVSVIWEHEMLKTHSPPNRPCLPGVSARNHVIGGDTQVPSCTGTAPPLPGLPVLGNREPPVCGPGTARALLCSSAL